MLKKMALSVVLALCLALAPLLVFNARPVKAQTENQLPLWGYTTGSPVESVSISSNGNYMVAGAGAMVYLFSKTSGTPLWSYQASNVVISVSISSDGAYAVAGDYSKHVYLFSRDSGTPLWSCQVDSGYDYVKSVSISSDGNYIVAGAGSNVHLFSYTSSTPLWSYTTGGFIEWVAVSSDGSYIVAGSDDYSVYLFSRDSSTPLWSYETGSLVRSVSISADGSRIAAGSGDHEVYLFSKTSSTPLWSYNTGEQIESVSISSDGNYVSVGDGDHKVYLFSKTASTPLWSYETGDFVRYVSISSDGAYIAAGDQGGAVYLFSKYSSTPLWSHPMGSYSGAISSDGGYVAAGSAGFEGEIHLFNVEFQPPNDHPSLSSESVSPSSGTPLATFTYEVTYIDNDGDAPNYVTVCIEDTEYPMTKISGTYMEGALYRYQTALSQGAHTYYFEASDNNGLTARLPDSGSYSGPGVTESENISFENFEVTLTFFRPDGSPLADTTVYYSTSQGQEAAELGTTDSGGGITTTNSALYGQTVYFKSSDGAYEKNVYIGQLGGNVPVTLEAASPAGFPTWIIAIAVIGCGAAVVLVLFLKRRGVSGKEFLQAPQKSDEW